MQTLKLKIKYEVLEIEKYCQAYSYMFRKIYANAELMDDKGFEKELRDKYDLDSWIYQCCKTEVKMKLEQNQTQRNKKWERIQELEEVLANDDFIDKKRNKFKLFKKLAYLKANWNKNITFGGKALLRKMTYLSNFTDEESIVELHNLKDEFHDKRILPFTVIGEAPQRSNRKFDFDFENKQVIFKPKQGIKIPIEFYCSSGQHRILKKLQHHIGEQAITVRLNDAYIWIMFDEEKLAGFAFNENEYFRELKTIPRQLKQERKDCYIKYLLEQEHRKFVGKNTNRYIGFDLNPEYIGVCILEKTGGKLKIIFKEVISFKNLNTKLGLSSEDVEQIHQNNKRIHEVREVWARIFRIVEAHKVAHCVMEDLEFEESNDENAKAANKKTKNLWHRTTTEELIQKYCNINGLKLVKVNACYSSFIGNIKHDYYDPLNAALEVCRRGVFKYLKGAFYPPLERSDFDTMAALGLDVQNKTISTWNQAFAAFKTAGLRYRRELKNFTEHNLMSVKSGVLLYHF